MLDDISVGVSPADHPLVQEQERPIWPIARADVVHRGRRVAGLRWGLERLGRAGRGDDPGQGWTRGVRRSGVFGWRRGPDHPQGGGRRAACSLSRRVGRRVLLPDSCDVLTDVRQLTGQRPTSHPVDIRISRNQGAVDVEEVPANQAGLLALADDLGEEAPVDGGPEPDAGLRKDRVVRDRLVEVLAEEPAVGQVQGDLLDQPALGGDARLPLSGEWAASRRIRRRLARRRQRCDGVREHESRPRRHRLSGQVERRCPSGLWMSESASPSSVARGTTTMWKIQCAWCRRMKGAGGYPVGVPLPVRSAESHGICRVCKAQVMAGSAIQIPHSREGLRRAVLTRGHR